MANYPQLDDQVGVWKLKDVNSAVMGGYWRNGGSRALFGGGDKKNVQKSIKKCIFTPNIKEKTTCPFIVIAIV